MSQKNPSTNFPNRKHEMTGFTSLGLALYRNRIRGGPDKLIEIASTSSLTSIKSLKSLPIFRNTTKKKGKMHLPTLLKTLFLTATLATAAELQIDVTNPVECNRKTTNGDTVKMHYRGTLADSGKQFDASYDRGTPLSFKLGTGRVIKGFVSPLPLHFENSKLWLTWLGWDG
jgi:hypothetical protein